MEASSNRLRLLDKGTDDSLVAVRLRSGRNVTFFTLDRDFFTRRREFGHASCAIAFIDVPDERFAAIVDRFLRHPSFRTHASRMCSVFKINEDLVVRWRVQDLSHTETQW